QVLRNVLTGALNQNHPDYVANGPRFFHAGSLAGVQGQQEDITLDRGDRALIHFLLLKGEELVNRQLANPPRFSMTGTLYGGLLSNELLFLRGAP
ncbi:MAG: hypothetical protein ABI376_06240, partial [Caulobacteraceae bacterium]